MKYHGLDIYLYKEKELEKLGITNIDTKYYSRSKIGQLKLLLNEIQFINELKQKNINPSPFQVCGGAPGIHYDILSDMYPDIIFILYDKQDFYEKLKNKKNIILKKKYVTNEIVTNEFDSNGVFISDMRTINIETYKPHTERIYKTIIMKDMYDQLSFFYTSKCTYGMLKFKVVDGLKISYPSGLVWMQPYINSNELRLVLTKDDPYIIYDGDEIDIKCQLINNYWRQSDSIQISDNIKNKKQIQNIIDNNRNLHYKWDTIALLDIIINANQLKWLDKILKYIEIRNEKESDKLNKKSSNKKWLNEKKDNIILSKYKKKISQTKIL